MTVFDPISTNQGLKGIKSYQMGVVVSKNLFFAPFGLDARSQNSFGNKQYQNDIENENFIQFGPRTTEQSLSETGAKLTLF